MSSEPFFAQDLVGNVQQIRIRREAAEPQVGSREGARHKVSYFLEDGSVLRRIDNETFQVIDTGAFITLVREYAPPHRRQLNP